MLPPPSTRARLPVPVCANAVMLLALMVMVVINQAQENPMSSSVKLTTMLLI
jgi:hypothetical protein